MKIYYNLYVSECWRGKKEKMINKLKKNRLWPNVYVIALSQGTQNQFEFFSGILLRQKIFREDSLFVVGLADGYDEALTLTGEIISDIYRKTGSTDFRNYVLKHQEEFESAGR